MTLCTKLARTRECELLFVYLVGLHVGLLQGNGSCPRLMAPHRTISWRNVWTWAGK